MSVDDVGPAGRRPVLLGRAKDLEIVEAFVVDSQARGGALLLTGEPGVGKSALLDAAVEMAASAGMRVMRTAGAEFEDVAGFRGLGALLRPLAAEARRLAPIQRAALAVILGSAPGAAVDRLVVSSATLELLRAAAAPSGLLIVVDDLPWLDRASAAVLRFVARRLGGTRIGLLAASRSEAAGLLGPAGRAEHELTPLDPGSAAELLDGRHPDLGPAVRRRLLDEARGIPLALLELPSGLTAPQRIQLAALPAVLPLTARLRAVFGTRVARLPPATRELLLVAALDGTGDLRVVLAAAAVRGLVELGPAEQAQLVDVGTRAVTFRHPLIRSAAVESAAPAARRRAHRALAEVLADQPERAASHLAAATAEPDAEVARRLERAAHLILRRGDAVGAVTTLLRAADLSPDRAGRSRRLAQAAYLGADVTGELRGVASLLDRARGAAGTGRSLDAAVAAAALLLNGDGNLDTAHRLLVGAIESRDRAVTGGQPLIGALHTLQLVCFFGGRAQPWEPFRAALAELGSRVPVSLSLCGATFADPARTAFAVLEPLEAAIEGLAGEADPTAIVRIGIAAFYVDRLAGCRQALWRVVEDGRAGGAVASAINALLLLCFDDLLTGRWDEARRLADEGVELCDLHGYSLLAWPGWLAVALVAAGRGDTDATGEIAARMVDWAAPRGVRMVEVYARHARAVAALGQGDHETAYQQVTAISPAGRLASHVAHALWVCMDLVEAAVGTGRHEEAAAHVRAMQDAGIARLSPRLALLAAGSAAMATPPDRAADLFEAALAVPGADRWPFERARIQLAYGQLLRRARDHAASRPPLTAAYETFRLLGALPWARRAADELRAAGRAVSGAGDRARPLTGKERTIAELAATGLTNKEIGDRLFLSPRTVAAHLYRAFPKLGVTTRSALSRALAAMPPEAGQA